MATTKSASTDAAAAKPKKARGPQKRVMHIFYRTVTGADGQPAVEIANVMSDARKVLEYVDSPEYQQAGLKRFKYELVSTPRADGEEDHSGTAVAE